MKDWQRNAAMALMIAGLLWCAPALAQMGGHDMSGMGKKDSDQSMDMGKKDKGGKDGMSGHGMGHVFGPGWMETLTDDQKKKAEEMHLQLKKDLSTLEAAKGLRKAELDLLVLQDNPDRKAIEKKIGEVSDLDRQIMLKKNLHRADMRAMLTPDQRVSFDSMVLGRGMGMGMGMGGHGH